MYLVGGPSGVIIRIIVFSVRWVWGRYRIGVMAVPATRVAAGEQGEQGEQGWNQGGAWD